MTGAVPPIVLTVTPEPEVTPVGAIEMSGVNEYVSVLGAEDERLQVTGRFMTVPFGTVNELSKLKVTVCEVAAVRVEPLTTREPVFNATEPFHIWHELK
jgi:glutamate-1-semialdehyde aminotransferase